MKKAKEAVGRRLGDIDLYDRLSIAKGSIGQVMEESHFGYKVNCDAEPDFKEAGVELKVTPYKRNSDKSISAKERLVLNIINYMTEHEKDFINSSLWLKNKCIQMMFYEHMNNTPKCDLRISHTIQYNYPIEDLAIIKNDWNTIITKIRQGKAHELSESDTLYLGACTKGQDSTSVRQQPFSDILARQRAYSLKQSYMTYLLRKYIFGAKSDERIVKDLSQLEKYSFEEFVLEQLRPHFGKTQLQLIDELGIKSTSKSINELIIAAILGVKGKVSQSEEFKKANIVPKTIRIGKDGMTIRESMSFPTFKFTEIINEEWETSTLKTLFDETKFMFVIFQFNEEGGLLFKDVIFWNIPNRDLEEVHKVWERTVKNITDGVIITKINGKQFNNLPKASENFVCHVRPHARDASDTYPLPDGRHLVKQCFWFNNTYVMNQIKKNFGKQKPITTN
jgi:DNA mismatch repair protein MutH